MLPDVLVTPDPDPGPCHRDMPAGILVQDLVLTLLDLAVVVAAEAVIMEGAGQAPQEAAIAGVIAAHQCPIVADTLVAATRPRFPTALEFSASVYTPRNGNWKRNSPNSDPSKKSPSS